MSESREEWKARMGIGSRSTAFRLAGGPGTTKTTAVPCDDAPGVAGRSVEHWDGRRDAVATRMTVTPTSTGRAALARHRSSMTKEST